ncbi:YkvA family protein [Arsenicicoccus bolidensis]|uniref:DUF1232 domain-containing protein n=1 Tax=Arsenicicoccus bolidensis TaxID=229480 RepID=A0ABS9Q3F3_9MICO|nr:YkvA family protein [Arsenicicoccus bolidensis]MCG7322403.1 DUF1232 domain-containing protein [Arsenicicoccus bolidensis]
MSFRASRPTSRWASVWSLGQAVRTASRPGSPSMATRIQSLPRLVRAVTSGAYTGTSRGQLLALAAAVVYVVSPLDLVPEGLFSVLGLGDDAFVLAWAAAQLVSSTEDFLHWERGGRRGPRPGDPAPVTVDGRVVR